MSLDVLLNMTEIPTEVKAAIEHEFEALQRQVTKDISERIMAEEALRETEAKYRSLLENISGMAFRGKMDFTPNFFHGHVEKITGYREEEFVSGNPRWDQIIHPDDLLQVMESAKKLIKIPNYAAERKYRIIRKNGHIRWVHEYIQNICDDSEKPIFVQGTIFDITEHLEIEETLRQQIHRMEERVKELTCLYGIFKALAEPELSSEEVILKILELIPLAWQYQEITCARIHFKDNSYATTNFQVTPWNQSSDITVSGCVEGRVEVFYLEQKLDIDEGPFLREERDLIDVIARELGKFIERKRVGEELLKTKTKLEYLLNFSPAVIYSTEPEANYPLTFISENVKEIMGYEQQSFLSDPNAIDSRIHPEERERIIASLDDISHKKNYHGVYRFLHKNGSYRWMLESAKLVLDGDGSPLERIGYWIDITELKQTEFALQESEERLRAFMESSIDMIAILDADMNYLEINKAGLATLGIDSVEEVIKKNLLDIIPHKEGIEVFSRFKEVLATGQPFSLDGIKWRGRFYSIRAFKVGNCLGMITTEITKRIKQEQQLRESEERFRKIFEDSPLGMAILGSGNTINDVNQSLCNMLGYSEEELKELTVPEITHPEDTEKDFYLAEQLNRGEIPFFQIDKRYLTKNSEVLWGSLTATAVHSKNGDFIYGVGMVENISDRKQMEMELLREKELNDSLIDNMPCVALLLRPETREIVVSNQEAKKFGAIPGKTCFQTWAQRDEPCPWCLLPDMLKTGERQHLLVENPTNVMWDTYWVPIQENLLLHYAFDVTEQQQAEKIRRDLESRRESFIWMTSHELRTPLTVLSGYFDFLAKNLDNIGIEQRKHIFVKTKAALRRLERLTDDVSVIAQLEGGMFRIEKQAFDFNQFFSNTITEYVMLLGSHLEVRKDQGYSPVFVIGDENRIRQVIDNVLTNAMEHTHASRRLIKISYEVLPSTIQIRIVDNGAGIAHENLELIFDQFVSIETEYSTPSTGLGLFLCRKIINAHGGSISAQSPGLGQGATFSIEVPRMNEILP